MKASAVPHTMNKERDPLTEQEEKDTEASTRFPSRWRPHLNKA
jgi:hypothetical protein